MHGQHQMASNDIKWLSYPWQNSQLKMTIYSINYKKITQYKHSKNLLLVTQNAGNGIFCLKILKKFPGEPPGSPTAGRGFAPSRTRVATQKSKWNSRTFPGHFHDMIIRFQTIFAYRTYIFINLSWVRNNKSAHGTRRGVRNGMRPT